ncbi:hypothetical protein EW145_g6001, partial [Phellinidium pouzarii]
MDHLDPFFGTYPTTPHLRPIALPETGSPAPPTLPGYANSGYGPGSSSRSRPMSLPPASHGTSLGIYGIPSPPASPSSGPAMHPLLRGSVEGSVPLIYNILFSPSAHGSRAVRLSGGARLSSH